MWSEHQFCARAWVPRERLRVSVLGGTQTTTNGVASNNRNVLFHSLDARSRKLRCRRATSPPKSLGEGPSCLVRLPGLWPQPSSLCLHLHVASSSECRCLKSLSSFLIRTQLLDLGRIMQDDPLISTSLICLHLQRQLCPNKDTVTCSEG